MRCFSAFCEKKYDGKKAKKVVCVIIWLTFAPAFGLGVPIRRLMLSL